MTGLGGRFRGAAVEVVPLNICINRLKRSIFLSETYVKESKKLITFTNHIIRKGHPLQDSPIKIFMLAISVTMGEIIKNVNFFETNYVTS